MQPCLEQCNVHTCMIKIIQKPSLLYQSIFDTENSLTYNVTTLVYVSFDGSFIQKPL